MNKFIQKIIQYAPLVAGLVVARIVPHPANFTPLSAAALWGGAALPPRTAGAVIIATMIVSDVLLGFDNLSSRLTVYGSLIMTVILGRIILNKRRNVARVVTAAIAASVSFFLITNFSVWLFSDMYPRTIAGLISCYYMALPFLRNSAVADLFFVGVFFGGWELARILNTRKAFISN